MLKGRRSIGREFLLRGGIVGGKEENAKLTSVMQSRVLSVFTSSWGWLYEILLRRSI